MATVLINGRVDEEIKKKTETVLEKRSLNASEAIRMLWQYISETNDVPPFMIERLEGKRKDEIEAKRKMLLKGAGIVKTTSPVDDREVERLLSERAVDL